MLLGVEIGGTKIQLVVGDESARIVDRRRFAVERSKGAAGIQQHIQQGLYDLLANHKIKAVGVGFGGPVDWQSGSIARSHHIEGWTGFPLGKWLQELAGVPVAVDNDANVAALGEAAHGAGVGFNPAFYVTLGSGVGGGLVVDGRVYHGEKPGEMEIGHVRLDRKGTILESRCSGWSVDARIRELSKTSPESQLVKLTAGQNGGEAKHLTAALTQGDAAAQKILHEVAADLAFGLSHVVQLLHPQIIILGGGLSLVGEPLRAEVDRMLKQWIMEVFQPGPKVCLSALGEDVIPVGALELARRKLR